MGLAQVQNMTASELKANRDTIIAGIVESLTVRTTQPIEGSEETREVVTFASPAELAARNLSNLIDAKERDETLAEQGAKISTLTTGHDAAKANAANLAGELVSAKEAIAGLESKLAAEQESHAAELKLLQEHLGIASSNVAEAQGKRDAFRAEAIRNRTALNTAYKAIADAVALQVADDMEKTNG